MADSVAILIYLFILFMAVTFHEFSHGYMAYRLGDDTALRLGRLTLNPVAHFDLMGSLVVPLITYFSLGFPFGWAKPVPFIPQNLTRRLTMRQGMALVGGAGPAANIALAVLFAIAFRLSIHLAPHVNDTLFLGLLVGICEMAVTVNIALALFNLLPVPPLDGSRVVLPFLSRELYNWYVGLERHGFLIIIGLMLINHYVFPVFTPLIALMRYIITFLLG